MLVSQFKQIQIYLDHFIFILLVRVSNQVYASKPPIWFSIVSNPQFSLLGLSLRAVAARRVWNELFYCACSRLCSHLILPAPCHYVEPHRLHTYIHYTVHCTRSSFRAFISHDSLSSPLRYQLLYIGVSLKQRISLKQSTLKKFCAQPDTRCGGIESKP